MATAERNDEAPNCAPLGAMGSLLRRLDMLPCTDDGGGISELKDYIHSIRDKLKKLSEVQDPPLTVNYWMKHARELSYDIEAYLDGFDAQTEDSLNDSDAKEGDKPDDSYAKMKDCIDNSDDETEYSVDYSHAEMEDNPDDSDANMEDPIDDDSDDETEVTVDNSDSSTQDSICSSDYKISGFMTRAKGMIDRYERFGLDSVLSCPTAATTIVSPRPSRDVVLVGMGNQMTKLMSLLQPKDENDNQLKIVSILGDEGIGKSTLIQELWRVSFKEKEIWPEPQSDVKIKRAFVRMGKTPDVRMILRSILSQVSLQEPPKDSGVTNLIQDIRKHLEQKRYFIIVDDVQSLSVWDVFGHAFPRCSFGSRIITTTSDKEAALACCSYVLEHNYVMEPLSGGDCKELFIRTVVGFRTVNLQLSKDVSGEIKRKCGGLPLGIMWTAILVASQPEIKEKLCQLETEQRLSKMEKEENLDSYVKKFLDKNLRTESTPVEILNQVLKLCYNSLPHHLKTCLLYLSVYPENYFFLKEDLVKLWIAEGFICTSEEDKVEAAGRYFDVLISLGLIQRMNINCNKQHHQGEVAEDEGEEDPLRIPYIVHPTVFDFITCKSTQDNFITIIDHSQSTAEFKDKIRRLSLQFGSATYATTPASIGLSQVRTLSLIGLSRCMPSLVEFKLIRVVILHLWADDEDKKFVLAEIDKLLLLRYLQARCNVSIELTGQIGCLKHLETLEINSVFTTLGPVSDQRFELLPPMDDSGSTSTPSVQIFELLPLICIFSRLPMWIPQLRHLSILEIVVREMLTTDIDMLADLPALTALSLYVRIPTAGNIVFSRGTFPDLKYFKFMCGVLSLDFQEEAMPSLQRLMIGFNVRRREKYDNILAGTQHLLNLQEVVASIGATMGTGETDRIAAESALKDAINKHQRPTKFNVKRVHQVEEEYHPPPLDPLRINEQEEVPLIHGQQTEDSTNGQPINLDKMPAEDTHEHANFGTPYTLDLQEDDNTSTQQKSGSQEGRKESDRRHDRHDRKGRRGKTGPSTFASTLPPLTCTILPTLASHQGTPAGQLAEREVAIGDAERPAQGGSKGVDAGKECRERKRCAGERVDEGWVHGRRGQGKDVKIARKSHAHEDTRDRDYAHLYTHPDIPQILLEAQTRWLRPTEICQILSNYKKFSIAPEPPNRPQSGSLFLFDRKILRYFRKDGHNWRKKKDGKTVKEAHEKLKVGSVDVLHCYYAHGEENENFQRRTYWLLEEGFMNIVLVHYLEIKGVKQSFNRAKEAEENAGLSNADSPACSNSFASQSQVASQSMDAESPISGQISEYEDAETDNSRASSRYHPFTEMQQPVDGIMMGNLFGASPPSVSVNNRAAGYLGEMQPTGANLTNHFATRNDIASVFNETSSELGGGPKTSIDSVLLGEPFPEYPGGFMESTLYSSVATLGNSLEDGLQTFMSEALYTNNLTQKEVDALSAAGITSSKAENDGYSDQSVRYPLLKQSSSDLFKMEPDGLKKFDSFSRWMNNELPEVADLDIKSSSDAFWSTTETVNVADGSSIPINEQLDAFVVSPSLSQDQLFSIIDVSPSWAYNGTKTKVLITGTFLAKKEDVENCRWSCMFGDAEVSADVLVDGSLRCYTPVHCSGRVPFYVTCSNRVACSEVREFEFRDSETHYMDTSDQHTTGINEMHLHIRLDKLLSLEQEDYEKYVLSNGNKSELIDTINSLMLDDNLSNLALPFDEKELSTVRDQNVEKQVKEKLYYWLIHKIHDDGKGPNVLGKEGQGAIHLVAALGYDWAIKPIVAAGVNINFRDIRGWTALHWAASCGRERTVGALIANGAAPGPLTDPTQQYPSGRTPADLASENGYKGIAGFLAESALTSHLSALTLKESQGGNVEEICGLTATAAEDFAEPSSSQLACANSQEESLKDSLGAVRKSTQAAARIFQAFRVESFHRKKVIEYGDDDCGLSDERTLSLVSLRNPKPGHGDLHSAAVRIQNKFRGWKGRKEFMIIRQKIVKIQAHVRGHQVRKNYRKVVWSVGIVEKVILRWRRKRRGLRGFQPEKQLEGPSWQIQPAKAEAEDEYDFLKDGRKQAEGRLQRALARVRSMNQYPEARDQYRRLQACVNSLQESQAMQDRMLADSAGTDGGDFMAELEELCRDDGDAPMSTIS